MTQPRILNDHEAAVAFTNTLATAIQARQEAAEATRRAEAAEERCKALSEALRALVGDFDANLWSSSLTATFERARALLEES